MIVLVDKERIEKLRRIEVAVKKISARYKTADSNIIMKASEIKPPEKLSTGVPSLDIVLGGGIDYGRFTTIFGGVGTAKSTLCSMLIANAQRANKVVLLIDAENRFDPHWASKLGVNVDELMVPDLRANVTEEEVLDMYTELVQNRAADLIIIDSVSALTPQEEADKTLAESTMALSARILSKFFRRIVSANRKHNVCGVLVGQTRSSMNMYPSKLDGLACGNAIKFYSHYIIATSRKQPQSSNVVTRNEGFLLGTSVVKGPGIEGVSLEHEFRHNEGIDIVADKVSLLVSCGLITREGSSYTLGSSKFRGYKALVHAVKGSAELQTIVDDMMQQCKWPQVAAGIGIDSAISEIESAAADEVAGEVATDEI